MCSSLIPSCMSMSPQMRARVESLLKPPYDVLDDPWYDSFPSLSSFFNKGKDIASSKTVNNFNLFLHINEFKQNEINVKTLDGFITIEAKHDGDTVSREFKRSYQLPEDIDPSTLVSNFNEKGLLVVKAFKKVPESKE